MMMFIVLVDGKVSGVFETYPDAFKSLQMTFGRYLAPFEGNVCLPNGRRVEIVQSPVSFAPHKLTY
jgi:hypothetical protein